MRVRNQASARIGRGVGSDSGGSRCTSVQAEHKVEMRALRVERLRSSGKYESGSKRQRQENDRLEQERVVTCPENSTISSYSILGK